MEEAFFRTHTYLVEHTDAPVRRTLMDEIDWSDRLIGIKGTRGVGKSTFLLQYAKEHFGPTDRKCLYVNMNNFYFQSRGIADFAGDFVRHGGRTLLIDQVFKQSDWSKELRKCYDLYPELRIVFTGSSVMRLKEENPELNGIVKSYNLRGFSFREFINLQTGNSFKPYTLDEILRNHEHIIKQILPKVSPIKYFQDYLHHGFYPFFLENRNFTENLLKTMNMMTEVDILLIKQIELKYLTKIKRLFYQLAVEGAKAPNVSQLAEELILQHGKAVVKAPWSSSGRGVKYVSAEDFRTAGSGAVFFSGCNLKCIFCQNEKIRDGLVGKEITEERLSDIFLKLQDKGANNINLVTAGHFLPKVIGALEDAKNRGLEIPIVYNTSSYEKVEAIRELDGLVDVYLPDMKYVSSRLSGDYSKAADYFEVATRAIEEMVRQTGELEFYIKKNASLDQQLGLWESEDLMDAATYNECADELMDEGKEVR